MMKDFKSHSPLPKGNPTLKLRHATAPKIEEKPDPQAKVTETGEKGGPQGPEPTRYGDWERKGICYDF